MKTPLQTSLALIALSIAGLTLAACEQDTREDMSEEASEAAAEIGEMFQDDNAVEDSAEAMGNAAEETGDEMEEAVENN